MFRTSVLVLALVMSAPTIWAALGTQTIGVEAALIRFLIAVPIATVLVGCLRAATRRQPARRDTRDRVRRTDSTAPHDA